MKRLVLDYCLYTILVLLMFLQTSCATICGGARYKAEVIVDNHPNARIELNDRYIGSGRATTKISRRNANKVNFTVREEGKTAQYYSYNSRSFRGWALFGTIVGWTGFYDGIILPWGIAVDAITGALWKPDEDESGIEKVNRKRYRYHLTYNPEVNDSSNKNGSNNQEQRQYQEQKQQEQQIKPIPIETETETVTEQWL